MLNEEDIQNSYSLNTVFSYAHYGDVIMGAIASQITSLTIIYSTVYSDADQRKHQSSASLAFVRGIHRGPVNSPHKRPFTRKMFPFDDVIMAWRCSERSEAWQCPHFITGNCQHPNPPPYIWVSTIVFITVHGLSEGNIIPYAYRLTVKK